MSNAECCPWVMVRRKTIPLAKTLLFLFGLTFLWVQLHVTHLPGDGHRDLETDGINASALAALAAQHVPPSLHKYLSSKPKHTPSDNQTTNNKIVQADPNEIEPSVTLPPHEITITQIQNFIEAANDQQAMMNDDIFGPVLNDTIIIVVQVHQRINYLRHLIISLAQARDIDGVLLVFSHDYYDEDVNDLVRSVDFCKVMQIFYPHSIQTHPHEYPGQSPYDCPRDIGKEQAAIRRCLNALYPDHYGHYREAKFTQTKHHWWWKANRVFDQLEVTKNHSGLVLFLEEDHYVAEDFIPVLKLMDKTRSANCDKCNILSLGTYLKTHNYYNDGKKAELTPWISSKHNMGMAFDGKAWKEMKTCVDFFCTYDDYNWDWSLQHISQVCLKNKLYAMVMKGPRVFHIGECGVHHKKKDCESSKAVIKVQGILRAATQYLFPSHLVLVQVNSKKLKLRKGNGGWGDRRDHLLCRNMTTNR